MRRFNTSGPNIVAEHYTLPRLDLIEAGKELVHESRYFVMFSPPQTGKTTYLHLLATALHNEGYKVAYVNFEKYNHTKEVDFLVQLGIELFNQWELSFDVSSIVGLFRQIESIKTGKMVLIVDGIEDINKTYLWTFLSSIRSVFHSRQHHALKSVILAGVRNIIRYAPNDTIPFNIGDDFELPYFSNEETYALLAQHEQVTGQLFEDKVKAKISDITANHPYLVNGLASKLAHDFPNKFALNYDDYLQVEAAYLKENMSNDTFNIVKKAEKYRSLFEYLLFAGSKIPFMIYHERTKELVEHGLITHDKDYYINLKIPLHQKHIRSVFYPYHHEEGDYIQRNFNADDYVDTSGILNLDKVIEAYKIYKQQRRFVYFRTQDSKGNFISIPEAAMMYSFETFINGVLGVLKGKSYLEANTALGRTDLLINVRGYEQVVEAKVFKNITQFEDGKAQLAYYTQHLSLKTAYYLVFADTEVTHSNVVEADEIIEGIRIKTYLVRYELDKDFTLPRKKKPKK